MIGLCLREPRFVEDPNRLTTQIVSRSWRDRLFTWPWRPWVAQKTVHTPDPMLYFDASTMTYIGHPATLRELRRRTEVPNQN